MPISRICTIPDCGKPHYAKGYCLAHYTKWRLWGAPTKGLAIISPTRENGTTTAKRASPGEPEMFYRDVVLTYDSDECLIWPFGKVSAGGYGHLNGNSSGSRVHRLVCEAIHGAPPTPGHLAAHSCGNPPCVNHRHLRWATHAENNSDMAIHGTMLRGEQLPQARLTKDDVIRIRELASEGILSNEQIGDAFGICRRHVRAIANRECWKHI